MSKVFLNIRNKFRMLSELPVLIMASRDKRSPFSTKLMLGLTIVYFFSPIDFIPDFIPVLGIVDDIFMVPFLTSLAIKTVPEAVLTDTRYRLKKTRNLVLIIFFLAVAAIGIYYGYQYYQRSGGWDVA